MERIIPSDVVLVADPNDLLAPEGDVVEVPLLLSGWQMSALEREAHRSGRTAGEMVRQLLRDFLAAAHHAVPSLPGKVGSA
jgi:hypothetical protein